ncbi:MAG: Uma2 family endonuclease [Chloroflexota bacterium]|nr:Uma2 family endonuclease [Chloroflexota bacterium]
MEPDPVVPEPYGPIVLKLPPAVPLTDDVFFELCALNNDLRIELSARGDVELMAPTGGTTGNRNGRIFIRLGIWAESEGSGEAFDSSTGFKLPNGAVRSPDGAWVLKSRWETLSHEEQEGVPSINPDFVIELRSPSDPLRLAMAKMEEYMENGVRLGWLIDRLDRRRRVYIYRPNTPVEILEAPESISGDPELPGFTLELTPIW